MYFDSNASGAGEHTITYSFTNSNGCCNEISTAQVVHANPEIALNLPDFIGNNEDVFTLHFGYPAGGNYTMNDAPVESVHPALFDEDIYELGYTVVDQNGCLASVFDNLVFYESPEAPEVEFDGRLIEHWNSSELDLNASGILLNTKLNAFSSGNYILVIITPSHVYRKMGT